MHLSEYSTTLPSGSHWSLVVRRGVQLKITDQRGGANVGGLFYNASQLSEKYNAPDTLKCQHTFKLTRGHCLYSDMGRILCSIVDDDFGWHDSVCGNISAAQVAGRWGRRDYQTNRNDWHQNGNDSFLIELAKYDLTARDMAMNVNFFSQVQADSEGKLELSRRSEAGDSVTLRFEMDSLVLLHNCPHPFNCDADYPTTPIGLELSRAEPVAEDDLCLNSRPENRRGFQNNALYHFGLDEV